MTDDEKREHLEGYSAEMDALVDLTGRLIGHLRALWGAGIALPNAQKTAENLLAISHGWASGRVTERPPETREGDE